MPGGQQPRPGGDPRRRAAVRAAGDDTGVRPGTPARRRGLDGGHDRHAAYFRTLAEPAESELREPGQLAWLDRLEAEHDNLGAAVSWLVDQDQLAPAVDLVWATWRSWWLDGHAEELASYMERILAKSERMPPHQHALTLSGTGFNLMAGGDQARAERLLEQSLPMYHQAGDKLGAALTAGALGHLLASQHEYPRASELLEQTLGQLRAAGSDQLAGPERVHYRLDVALADNFLGQIRLVQGDQDRRVLSVQYRRWAPPWPLLRSKCHLADGS